MPRVKMDKIICKCGNDITKVFDYSNSHIRKIDGDGFDIIIYNWICKNCGRYYYEEIKDGIIKIENKNGDNDL